ncbi:nucleoside-diphosphate kinase [Desulfovibrio legallii]|jgi:nucleoside-diphosphate kinase|uniref:Nucleoside diphosphate kinase n=1 Tax=Desulfovibrio legallii TaxID=571438 RepID=A0A1G7ICY7_9BACT|nr:nucleoside-diphosphate kinase [Desulfovibrio legallii]SDF10374.1 nucleoside diphosphate kinase [Desulfovibrio legallii]
MQQTTFAIVKPDAVARNLCGEILAAMEAAGLRIVGLKRLRLSKLQAAEFYAVHRERPFFDSLTDYMSSGPVVCAALRGEDAIARWRALMGATDPTKAAPGTLRSKYGQSLEANAVHGSDAPETAAFELGYFFNGLEIVE